MCRLDIYFSTFILILAACESSFGLAMVFVYFWVRGSVRVDQASLFKSKLMGFHHGEIGIATADSKYVVLRRARLLHAPVTQIRPIHVSFLFSEKAWGGGHAMCLVMAVGVLTAAHPRAGNHRIHADIRDHPSLKSEACVCCLVGTCTLTSLCAVCF